MHKAALAALLILASAGGAHAADLGTNLFISPCGEPFLAPGSAPYPIAAWFDRADANHDGKLDLDEFRGDCERFFAKLDRNKDGVIDGAEISVYEHLYVPEILTPGRADAAGLKVLAAYQLPDNSDVTTTYQMDDATPEPPPRPPLDTKQGAVIFSLFPAPEPVLSADRNLDGKVTLKEFQAQAERRFAALDVQKRGYLLLADLPKTEAEQAAHARRR
jgi:hypothetical protein